MRHLLGPSLVVVAVLSSLSVGCDTSSVDPETRSSALSSGPTYLVSFSGGAIPSDAATLVGNAGGTITASYPNVGVVLAQSPSATFAAVLRATGGIAAVGAVASTHSKIELLSSSAGPSAPMTPPTKLTGDPLSFRQWDMDQIHAPLAHLVTTGKKSVLVGLVDSGVDITHPELAGVVNAAASASCLGGIADPSQSVWANDIIGHGTHTSGIIAAQKNGIGTVGVAPGVTLAMVKVAVDDVNDPNFGLVFPDAMVCGIEWGVAHGYDLLNASLTVDPFTGPVDDIFCDNDPDRAAVITIIRGAINAAAKKKMTVVAAAGNFNADLANLPGSGPGVKCDVLPVSMPKVIGVSAVGYTQLLSFYSNYGKGAIDVAGPGGDGNVPDPLVTDTTASGQVLSSVPAGSIYYGLAAYWNGQVQDCSSGTCVTYAYLQGTSQAAPHVTGVAALLISKFGKMQPDALAARLRNTATPLPCPVGPYDPAASGNPEFCKGPPNNNNFYGAGEVDALGAVLR
ncbi:MAG TPA: S8 family serine peptidase [Polyangia bacterium]|nr:S8 family serine peptidase [Polyangia bacterium]